MTTSVPSAAEQCGIIHRLPQLTDWALSSRFASDGLSATLLDEGGSQSSMLCCRPLRSIEAAFAMDFTTPPPSPRFQPIAAADGELSPNRRRLLALLQSQHDEERRERRSRQAALDPFTLAADERSLLLLAAAGLLVFLCLLTYHSPPSSSPRAAAAAGSERGPAMEDAWLSQWIVRGAEQPWTEQQRAALQKQLATAMLDSRQTDDSSEEGPTAQPPHSALAVSTAATTTASATTTATPTGPSIPAVPRALLPADDDSSPLPVSLLASSSAITEAGFRGLVGVVGTACSRSTDRAECGERRQCSGHGECVIRDEFCQGFYRYIEWGCDCGCGWEGVWCQHASGCMSASDD